MREYRSTSFLRFIYRKVITAHPSLALKVYKCKVLERFRNIEKAPSRDHSQDDVFLLRIRANTSRRNRRWRNRCSSEPCLVDLKGFEPSTSRMRTERSPSWATSPYSLAYLTIIHIPREKARGISAPAASLAGQNADINFMYFTYVYFVIYYFLLRVCAAFDDFNTTP